MGRHYPQATVHKLAAHTVQSYTMFIPAPAALTAAPHSTRAGRGYLIVACESTTLPAGCCCCSSTGPA